MKNFYELPHMSFYTPICFLKSISIVDIGYDDFKYVKINSNIAKSHSSPYHVFHFVVKGKCDFYYQNKKYKIGANTVYYFPSFYKIKYNSDKSNPCKHVWFGVKGVDLAEYLKDVKGITPQTPILELKNPEEFTKRLVDFFENNTQETITEEKMLALFFTLIDNIKDTRVDKQISTQKLVDEMKELISNNYMNTYFNINVAIQTAYLSHSRICTLFKEETGISMKQYLNKIRLSKSRELLETTTMSIIEISYQCGYRDSLYFSAAFKKFYGCSPSSFRNAKGIKL